MKIIESTCKNALSLSKLPGLDYSLNPYRGCEHQCAYCYVPNVLKIKRESWGNFVDIKTNIPLILSKEIKNKKRGIIGISTVTDPYQPIEKKFKITRYCLEQLIKYDFPICIQSKSSLILRDIELISKFSNAEVIISISTFNDVERELLEPNSSPINERLNVLRNISKKGIKTSVFFGPIYPTIEKKNLNNILNTFIDCGVSEIIIDQFNMRPGILKNIKCVLKKNKKILEIFSKKLDRNNYYYNTIRESIIDFGKNKRIKIKEAF